MKKEKLMLSVIVMVCGVCVFLSNQVLAEESSSVTVRAILPKNQKDSDILHYDLMMKPKQEQNLELELANSSKEDKLVKLEILNASTDDSGVIVYKQETDTSKRNETLGLALTDVATVPKEVVVKGNSKENVKINVKMPAETYKGVVAGAVRSTESLKTESKDNQVVYTVGINLSESTDEVLGDLAILKAFPDHSEGKNVVKATIENKEAQFIEEISYQTQITKKGNTEVLYEKSVDRYRMAPNSSFNLETSLNNQPLKAGDYLYKVVAESKRTGQKWELTKEFTISKSSAKKLNSQAVGLVSDKKSYYVLGTIGLIILLLTIISIRMSKRQKRKKKSKSKKRKGKSKSKRKKTTENKVKSSSNNRKKSKKRK